MIDIALSAPLLVVLSPVIAAIAVAIWLEDHGRVFYRQERMGIDGKSFRILKFRSMRQDAEASTGPIWAIRNDPRRTASAPSCAAPRSTSCRSSGTCCAATCRWSARARASRLRQGVQAQGAAVHAAPSRQVRHHRLGAGHGWRGNTSIRKRIQYDIYYIENWSLRLDFKILWMTLRHGMRLNAH